MQTGGNAFIRGLVAEEIRRLVAEAIERGGRVSVAECVAKIRMRYPNFEISEEHLADEVMMAATAAEVPVEIGRWGIGPKAG